MTNRKRILFVLKLIIWETVKAIIVNNKNHSVILIYTLLVYIYYLDKRATS